MKNQYPKNWASIRQKVIELDNHKCQYCGFHYEKLDVHHIRPLSQGGNNEAYNLVALCEDCHSIYHDFIRNCGLAMVPTERHEPYRAYLTNYLDMERYIDHLESKGVDVTLWRELNRKVGS